MSNLRIALITREYPPETSWGGIGSFYSALAKALSAHGFEVEVFSQGQSTESITSNDGITTHRVVPRKDLFGERQGGDLGNCTSIGLFASSLALSLLEAFNKRHAEAPFDIVESHEHLGVGHYINLHFKDIVKSVVRYHTAYHTLVKRHLVDWPASPLIESLELNSIRSADYLIASSPFIESINREDFDVRAADSIIYNFAGNPKLEITPRVPKEDLVVFVGRFVKEHKRPDLAIAAFAALSPELTSWRLELAGPDMHSPSHGTVWAECKERLRALPPERFQYHGVITPTEVSRLFARAKIAIIPSAFESFGMVALEAMREGCVPVVSDRTALPDLVETDLCVFRNGNLEDLIGKLKTLITTPHLLERLAAEMRDRASAFSETRIAAQNVEFFRNICQPSPRYRAIERDARASHPLVSIVTPSYQQGAYIEETIRSVCDQNYRHIEHIIVDGGSTDQTAEIVKRYPHVRFVHEPDLGQAHAINKGILIARGEIVAYLNSDDVYRPGAISAVVAAFQKNPGAQIIVGNCDYIDGNSKVFGHLKAKYTGHQALTRYWDWDRHHCIPQQAVFWRKNLLAEIGLFNVSLHYVMDYEMWLRISSRYPFQIIDQTLAAFRIVPTTKTGGSTEKMYMEEFETASAYWRKLPFFPRLKIFVEGRRHVARKFLDVAEHLHLSTSKGKKPARLALHAIRSWPPQLLDARLLYTLAALAVKGDNRATRAIVSRHRNHLNRLWLRSQRKH